MQIRQCITQTKKSVRLFIKRKVETASLFFFCKMRANFALKSGWIEWTRTTDPHLKRHHNIGAFSPLRVVPCENTKCFLTGTP